MRTNRRQFIRTTALSGVGVSLFSGNAFSWTENNSVRLAYLTDSDSSVVLDKLLQRTDIDAIIVDVIPAKRTDIALAAMNAGKSTAFTGPVGQTVSEIQTLSQTHAKTGTPCLLLDNDHCDRNVLAIKSMVQKQRFGEITHVACGTDSPTNGLGPAMDWLGINKGNRFVSLNASLSRSWGLHEPTPTQPLNNQPIVKNYELGEVLTINLQCANGQTLTLSHDITGKRPHSRGYRVQGTKGLWIEDNDAQPANQPEQTALTGLISALKTKSLDPNGTRNALTISLLYAIANVSLAASNDDLEIPDWFSQPA